MFPSSDHDRIHVTVVRVDRAVRNRTGLADEVELRHQEVRRSPRGERQRDDGLSVEVDREGRVDRRREDRGRPVLARLALIALVPRVTLGALRAVGTRLSRCAGRSCGTLWVCGTGCSIVAGRTIGTGCAGTACGTGRTGRTLRADRALRLDPCGPSAPAWTCRPLRTVRAVHAVRRRPCRWSRSCQVSPGGRSQTVTSPSDVTSTNPPVAQADASAAVAALIPAAPVAPVRPVETRGTRSARQARGTRNTSVAPCTCGARGAGRARGTRSARRARHPRTASPAPARGAGRARAGRARGTGITLRNPWRRSRPSLRSVPRPGRAGSPSAGAAGRCWDRRDSTAGARSLACSDPLAMSAELRLPSLTSLPVISARTVALDVETIVKVAASSPMTNRKRFIPPLSIWSINRAHRRWRTCVATPTDDRVSASPIG